jgi:acetamidase/formamidase
MLSGVALEYKITGPLHVNGRKPGDVVLASELTDAEHLVRIGWLEPVESGTSSSTMKKPSKPSEEKS